jgi:hypothetical protein
MGTKNPHFWAKMRGYAHWNKDKVIYGDNILTIKAEVCIRGGIILSAYPFLKEVCASA